MLPDNTRLSTPLNKDWTGNPNLDSLLPLVQEFPGWANAPEIALREVLLAVSRQVKSLRGWSGRLSAREHGSFARRARAKLLNGQAGPRRARPEGRLPF